MRTSRARDQRVIRSSGRMNGAHIAPGNATVKNFHHVATARLSEHRIARDAAVIRISNEGLSNPTPGPWQCTYSRIVSGVMITPILIICSLTVLLFGFDSSARNESNRFQRWLD